MAAVTSSIKEVAEFKIELDASLGVDISNVTVSSFPLWMFCWMQRRDRFESLRSISTRQCTAALLLMRPLNKQLMMPGNS